MGRGAIWVSAVLYIAIGTIVISMLLAAALPLVAKIKDRNSFVQAKEMVLTIDGAIRTVATEGLGSQRELSPLTINAGQLTIDAGNSTITWSMETSADLLEPNVPIKEGVLTLVATPTPVVGKNRVLVYVTYRNVYNLTLTSNYQPPYMGTYTMVIRHTGDFTQTNKPTIELRVL